MSARSQKKSTKKIGLILKLQDAETNTLAKELLKKIFKSGGLEKVAVEPPSLSQFSPPLRKKLEPLPLKALLRECSVVVVLGGDGTILRCARHLLHGKDWKNTKLVGVNTGHLGFLASFSSQSGLDELPQALKKPNALAEEKHSCLKVEVHRNRSDKKAFHVMNDCVLSKGSLSRIFEFHVDLNGTLLSSYRADGLIVSPPTGSTAYNLAAGGSIVQPGVPAIQLTAICPQYFSSKPIVISDKNKIGLRLGQHSSDVFLTMDGHTGLKMDDQDQVQITKSEKSIRFLVPKQQLNTHYFDSLRQKLNWGLVS